MSHLTGNDNYFENFEVGAVYKHARGKTVTENDAVTICHLVMNNASGHFDDHMMKTLFDQGQAHVDRSLVYGGVTMSIVIGLAYQDTGENVIAEQGMNGLKLTSPVLHGDTLYAYTEVLSKEDVDDASGKVTFRHYGVNHRDQLVFQGARTALVAKQAV